MSDGDDNSKIKKRMEVTAKLYADRKLPTKMVELSGDNKYLKFFNSRAVAEFAVFLLLKITDWKHSRCQWWKD
ncbi:MAG: hypothetical protein WC841_04820 [Candidatus Shapirobacteria bacterium]